MHGRLPLTLFSDPPLMGNSGTEEFTFPWWEHAFNRAADNIDIAQDDGKVGQQQGKAAVAIVSSRRSPVADHDARCV